MQKIDYVVIGAGVVGLAIARRLSLSGREVVILDSETSIGTHTSSRNSEVIHAGISYPDGSLKAQLCVNGKEALYQYCTERSIPHKRIGKLIVASGPQDMEELRKYIIRGNEAGVSDLVLLDQKELAKIEPAVRGIAAVYSPSTGIVDSHNLMLSYLADAENAGAILALNSRVVSGRICHEGIVLNVDAGESVEILCNNVINAGGLFAHQFALSLEGFPPEMVPDVHYARGRYYTMTGTNPFNHLVYPVSREASLRVHVTLDLAMRCKFGPDLQWVDKVDYTFDDSAESAFYDGIRRYFPDLRNDALLPGYTGIRPRLAGPNAPLHSGAADFVIQGTSEHGIPGLINLFGIESPGLTSSLAIANYVTNAISS